MNQQEFFQFLLLFVFLYPLLMSYVWMFGAAVYYFRYEFRKPNYNEPPLLPEYPLVTILLPCYNEEKNLLETLEALEKIIYPNYEIIAINDGSSDRTQEILEQVLPDKPLLRVIQLAENQGKALALTAGAVAAKGEFLMCIDGDAILDAHAVNWMMTHFIGYPRVGAVTGNPRIRTRTTALGRIQVGEFSAIIGCLKRAQRTYGRVFTVSGVCSAFRKAALHQVGYWNKETMTEDIDISWRLQLAHWDIRFEPRALCWILMPETLRGLLKQRYRWAVGGGEALKKYCKHVFNWKSRRMWGIYLEYATSVIWAYSMFGLFLLWVVKTFFGILPEYPDVGWIPQWQGILLGFTCMLQVSLSMLFDYRYDYGLHIYYVSTIWYPLVYWMLNSIVTIPAFPKAMFRRRGARGRWVTTDRGVS